jgi:hypothetical protein
VQKRDCRFSREKRWFIPADGADDLAKKGKRFAVSTKLFRSRMETVSAAVPAAAKPRRWADVQ